MPLSRESGKEDSQEQGIQDIPTGLDTQDSCSGVSDESMSFQGTDSDIVQGSLWNNSSV